MTDAVKAFLDHLTYNRHLSAHSVRAYASDVDQYLRGVALAAGRRVSTLTAADLESRVGPRLRRRVEPSGPGPRLGGP